jgi:predicted cupin superfamily sugar epimerase
MPLLAHMNYGTYEDGHMSTATTYDCVMETKSAAAIIEQLNLQRHPEGGHFVETFRDPTGASTAIYYLLEAGERSHWHRVHGAAEVWHYYAGSPLELRLSADGHELESHRLGNNLSAGERPQLIAPAGWWQSAESLGQWTLVGCTVAPGFEFDNFELAPKDWRPTT